MEVFYKRNDSQLEIAVEDANELFNSEIFYELIGKHPGFSCSQKSPVEIAELIKNSNLKIELKLYKPNWKWSKVLGYFVKSHPNNIFLNIRKIRRSTNSITNTIVHECIHALDNHENSNIIEFGHNCGYFVNTAPYEIGKIAESIIDGGATEQTDMIDVLDSIIEDRIF